MLYQPNLLPSKLAMVPFVSVDNMMRIVNTIGAAKMIAEIADYIEADVGWFGRLGFLIKRQV